MTNTVMRQWFTWNERPAELCFLPTGLTITPILYSTRLRKTSVMDPRVDVVRLGQHTLDSGYSALETEFAGTTLQFHAGSTDPFTMRGGWTSGTPAEWGARFWVVLAVAGPEVRYDNGAVLVRHGTRWTAIVTRDPAIVVSGHDSIDALRTDLEDHGYFNLNSRADAAPVLALRFNLDMMRQGAWAAAVADAPDLALAKARAALAGPAPAVPVGNPALDAVRDIVGWNTVWDDENARVYTKVTRLWNLGRFAVWYNDQCYAALLAGVFDTDLARQNMAVTHDGATPQGNVACLVTSNDAWIDRSQPPLGALIAWQLFLRNNERSILTAQYATLLRNQLWWRRARDPQGTGLMSCGTSDVGAALYQGTHFGARNETGMDNSATHDEASYDPDLRCLSTWDVGLNSVIALDAEMLGLIAAELGDTATAAQMSALADRHRTLIRETLWDPERRIFANRQRNGGFVRSVSPTSFYPMLCGAASDAQIADLLVHMDDPATFATEWPLPNATRDDPAFGDNVYWRGRIWPNVNYLVWLALHRAGLHDRAGGLAARSHALFAKSWDTHRIAAENYNATTGAALDSGDTDGFYIWAALLPLMAVEEVCGFSPWHGWTLRNGPDTQLGPVQSPLGPVSVTRAAGTLTLTRGDHTLLVTDHAGLSQIRFAHGCFSCILSGSDAPTRLCLPQIRAVRVMLDGAEVEFDLNGAILSLDLPTNMTRGARLVVYGE